MIKWISSILIILLGIVISIILYLSTVGIETKSFNNLIEKRLNKKLNIKISKTKQTKSEEGIDA